MNVRPCELEEVIHLLTATGSLDSRFCRLLNRFINNTLQLIPNLSTTLSSELQAASRWADMESSDKDDIVSLIAALTKGMSLATEDHKKPKPEVETEVRGQEARAQGEPKMCEMSDEVFMDAKEDQTVDDEDASDDEKPVEMHELFESQSSTSAPTHFRLYDLPQEIRDSIFDLAYPTISSDVQLVSKHSWDIDECQRSMEDDHFEPRDFKYKVDEFLVSKRFFVEAAQAFARNQTCPPTVMEGILSAYCMKFDIDVSDLYVFSSSPNARHVRLRVRPRDFGSNASHLVTRTMLEDAQIANTTIYKDLERLSGLVNLHVEAADLAMDMSNSNARIATWQANLKILEKLLQPTALQAKVFEEYAMEKAREALAQGAPMRLYPSSEVLSDRSQLADTFANIPAQWARGSPIVELLCGEAKGERRSLVGNENSPTDGNKSWPRMDERELGCMLMSGEKPPKALVQAFLDKNHDIVVEVFKDKAASNVNEVGNVPDTDEGLLDMMYTNPAAMLAWARKAKAKEYQLGQLQAAVSSVSGILNGLELG